DHHLIRHAEARGLRELSARVADRDHVAELLRDARQRGREVDSAEYEQRRGCGESLYEDPQLIAHGLAARAEATNDRDAVRDAAERIPLDSGVKPLATPKHAATRAVDDDEAAAGRIAVEQRGDRGFAAGGDRGDQLSQQIARA